MMMVAAVAVVPVVMMTMGYPANYHQSYSHLVGICHNDEGWEYDTVKFPPYTWIMMNITMRGRDQTRQVELL